MMAETRIILDCEVMPGKQSAASIFFTLVDRFFRKNPKKQMALTGSRGLCIWKRSIFKAIRKARDRLLIQVETNEKSEKISPYVGGI